MNKAFALVLLKQASGKVLQTKRRSKQHFTRVFIQKTKRTMLKIKEFILRRFDDLGMRTTPFIDLHELGFL